MTNSGDTCGFAPTPQFVGVSSVPVVPPAGYSFPHGLFDFTLANCPLGGTVTVTITYPSALPAGTVYWKYGPTPGNPSPTWYEMPANIAGNTATFSITDGGLGDDDLTANGGIVDQGGPGAPDAAGTADIPTLSEWAMLVLLSLLLGFSGWRLRRRGVL
ncbi:MAG: IPTL-CTERM sorting domain-containing protein [Candidatus Competibacter sp.]